MTTQEITVRIAKTIQEQQYEPITVEVIIKETCPKKKYDERVDELINLASEKVFGYLENDSNQPEGEEDYKEDPNTGEEALEERGSEEEGSFLPEEGEEGYEEEGQGEENYEEEGQGEENYEGEGQGEEGAEDEFGDFFEDDPDGEEN